MMPQTAGRQLKLKVKSSCLVNGLLSPGAYFASHIPGLTGWVPGPPYASTHSFWEQLVCGLHNVPWGSGQTNNSDFQQASEEITAILAHGGSKNQHCKDPDLPPSCPACRDVWGIISHLHLYFGLWCISRCADCIKHSPNISQSAGANATASVQLPAPPSTTISLSALQPRLLPKRSTRRRNANMPHVTLEKFGRIALV